VQWINFYPYKMAIVQGLSESDKQNHLHFWSLQWTVPDLPVECSWAMRLTFVLAETWINKHMVTGNPKFIWTPWASTSSSEGLLFVLLYGHFQFWDLFSFESEDDKLVPIHNRLLQWNDWGFTCTTTNGQHQQHLIPTGWSSFTCGKNSHESHAKCFQDGLSPALEICHV
jgi:hypothetical protein